MTALAPDFRVIAPDLPFASPEKFTAAHSMDAYVDFLLEFVDALGLKKVSIFGNSVGGTLGLFCCLEDPYRFEKLIIRCPVWSSKQLPFYLRIRPLINLHQRWSQNPTYALKILEMFYRISARMSPISAQNIDSQPHDLLPFDPDHINPTILSSFLGHLLQVEFEALLAHISTETLILWGGQDSFIQSRWGNRLDFLLPNSKFVEMSGEYHNIATVKIQRLANSIISFVISRK